MPLTLSPQPASKATVQPSRPSPLRESFTPRSPPLPPQSPPLPPPRPPRPPDHLLPPIDDESGQLLLETFTVSGYSPPQPTRLPDQLLPPVNVRVTIDHQAFPHIFEQIIDEAPREALLALRQTSRGLRDYVDKLLFSHVVYRYDNKTVTSVRTHTRRPVPVPLPRLLVDADRYHLNRVRDLIHVLDIHSGDHVLGSHHQPIGKLAAPNALRGASCRTVRLFAYPPSAHDDDWKSIYAPHCDTVIAFMIIKTGGRYGAYTPTLPPGTLNAVFNIRFPRNHGKLFTARVQDFGSDEHPTELEILRQTGYRRAGTREAPISLQHVTWIFEPYSPSKRHDHTRVRERRLKAMERSPYTVGILASLAIQMAKFPALQYRVVGVEALGYALGHAGTDATGGDVDIARVEQCLRKAVRVCMPTLPGKTAQEMADSVPMIECFSLDGYRQRIGSKQFELETETRREGLLW